MSDLHPLFERLDFHRNTIADLETEIAIIKDRISVIKGVARDDAVKALRECPDVETRINIASELYWFHDDLINATTIGSVLGYAAQGVAHVVGKAKMRLTCVDCHRSVDYYPTSRSDMQYRKQSPSCVCAECEQKRKDSWVQRDDEKRKHIEFLRSLPYREYLQTDHWQQLRKRVLKWSKYRCQLCNHQGVLNVHHRTYEHLGDEEYKDLIVLCSDCHAKFHDKLPAVQS